ncbi:HNH endonuclease signature motif containing protein [Paenibacillus sp. FSL H8-0034]|uniref:HNH endonuclease signature motif containing protein n=1 Tax=Paenibacillus sp. FSL H8-0034 TaxID=2954671 RepID=UPI0030F65962
MFRYTPEQAEFIKENVKGRYIPELTDMFNDRFGTDRKPSHMRAYVKNNKLKSGIDARIKPGNVPFNKGEKKEWIGGEATQFKKGHKPHNYVRVGSERINGDDYVDVKIADPNKWRGKHLLVWEKNNGPIPKGYVIIFGDGNRRNFDPNNLILISRGQLAIMNKNGLIQNNADLTRTGIIMADIYRKIGERKRSKRRGRRSK